MPNRHQSGRHAWSSWSVLSSAQDPEELGDVDTDLIRESRHKRWENSGLPAGKDVIKAWVAATASTPGIWKGENSQWI